MIDNCPRCGYALTGLPEEYACPECGLRYDENSLLFWQQVGAAAWKALIGATVTGAFGVLLFYPFYLKFAGFWRAGAMILLMLFCILSIRAAYTYYRLERGGRYVAIVVDGLVLSVLGARGVFVPWAEVSGVEPRGLNPTLFFCDGRQPVRLVGVFRSRTEVVEFAALVASHVRRNQRVGRHPEQIAANGID